MDKQVQEKMNEIRALCKKSRVSELFLFGSAVRGELNESSDLDFAIIFPQDLPPLERGEAFFYVLKGLRKLFNREIDLVSYRVVKNPIFKSELDNTKVPLYAA